MRPAPINARPPALPRRSSAKTSGSGGWIGLLGVGILVAGAVSGAIQRANKPTIPPYNFNYPLLGARAPSTLYSNPLMQSTNLNPLPLGWDNTTTTFPQIPTPPRWQTTGTILGRAATARPTYPDPLMPPPHAAPWDASRFSTSSNLLTPRKPYASDKEPLLTTPMPHYLVDPSYPVIRTDPRFDSTVDSGRSRGR